MDALRGLAIVLVVIGHAVQSSPSFDTNVVFRVIYAFHMPLFMFVSGFVAAYSLKPMNLTFLRKKFFMLVVPFIAWYLLSYYLNNSYQLVGFHAFIKREILSPDWGLWFLWVLFLNFCLLAVARKLEQHIGLIAYALIWLAIVAQPVNYYGLSLVKWHFGFFTLGFLLHRYRADLARFKTQIMTTCLVGFPVLVSFWYRTQDPSFSGVLSQWATAHNAPGITRGVIDLYDIAVPLLGIGFTYFIIKLLDNMALHRVFSWLGLYTLEIYVTNQYFMRYAFGHGPVKVISATALALTLSLGLSLLLLRRVKLLDVLLLGGRSSSLNLVEPTKRFFKRVWWPAAKASRVG